MIKIEKAIKVLEETLNEVECETISLNVDSDFIVEIFKRRLIE